MRFLSAFWSLEPKPSRFDPLRNDAISGTNRIMLLPVPQVGFALRVALRGTPSSFLFATDYFW